MLGQTETTAKGRTRNHLINWLYCTPGIALCATISVMSLGIQWVESNTFGHPYIEAIVIAILIGMTIRSSWQPSASWQTGIAFSAKQLLEVAVMLLGASLSLASVAVAGPALLTVVAGIVLISLAFSFGVSRMLGLSTKMSILIACGNSICGNSAIAAVSPVIGASSDDVGASISITAILGVFTVIGLPFLIPLFDLTETQFGILAGLTVYAVPQVLAATVPVGIVSSHIGTLVKLIRILMLGPVVIALSLFMHRGRGRASIAEISVQKQIFTWIPWFIPGFLLLATLRSLDFIPAVAVIPIAKIAGFLTVVSMAALGLGVDLTQIGRVGGRVASAIVLSLVGLVVVSLITARHF